MNPLSFIVVFVIMWWMLLFMALPIGIKPDSDPLPGQDSGAPQNPRLWIKMGIVTVIAFVLTGLFFILKAYGMFSLWVSAAGAGL